MLNSDDANPSVMSTDLPAGVFLLDVREDDEWTAGHAPEAVHVRLGDLGARLGELPQDRELYVICRSGNRSAYAAQPSDRASGDQVIKLIAAERVADEIADSDIVCEPVSVHLSGE